MLCPLCGENKAENNGKRYTHREHIPPKCLFIDQEILITVPSCRSCNNGTSESDSDFKVALGIYLGKGHAKFWQETLKSFRYQGNKLKKEETLNKIKLVSKAQQFKKEIYAVPVKAAPIRKTISKIVRGLYWHLKKEIFPTNIKIEVFPIRQSYQAPKEIIEVLTQHGKIIRSNKSSFEAIYAFVEDRKWASLWLIRFYGEDCFLAFTDLENK